ncbi:SCP2 sterol-binding domain-containing protein [Micromonospora sp. WMMD1120]|uniref:SCP2 sterol-binding domain-containing protein n=1 Tax=Micromonospora sp. WMMD1120 TaxID=3016106 RepID=UPI002417816F|nr:SCP2 sterol-binding domain-containing protein [Micromonospora sp. WMMD1120]MDG4809854.1 SCP2 sterol-binding domain-containing protein [Micromonospora sp. WMMD1120]
MTATNAFFDRLTVAGRNPMFSKVCGSVRFDISDGDHLEQWLLEIDHGRMRVTRSDAPAGTVIRVSAPVADAMARGEVNGLAAITRGEILVDGDLGLALRLGRLFPRSAEAAERDGTPDPASRNDGPGTR